MKKQRSKSTIIAEPQPPIVAQTDQLKLPVGIDWADAAHAYHFVTEDGKIHAGELDQEPQAIADWLKKLQTKFPDSHIEICLESSRGALINTLLEHPVTIYPVNPTALANYRKAFAHGGGKNDPVDAKLIFQFLLHYRNELRPLQHDQPLTRELRQLSRDRRSFVDQQTALANELTAQLKDYFPAVLRLKPAKIYAEFMIKFLLKFATLQDAQAAGKTKLRKWFYGVGQKAKAEERVETLMTATPLTTDPVLLRTCGRNMQAICRQLQALNVSIKGYDAELHQLVQQHELFNIVESLPGAGDNCQARIIAALGDDKERFASANNFQSAAGIAPLTTQSGKSKYVSSRWACSKFMKQTFHEYAGLSIKKCRWAKAFYDSQIANGKSKQMAKRAVAYKWMRIIFKLWQTGTAYDDAKYTQRLKDSGSHLYQAMQKTAA